MQKIKLVKTGNLLLVDSTDKYVISEVRKTLTYQKKIFHRGLAAKARKSMGLSPVELVDVPVFDYDREGRIGTVFGYWYDIANALTRRGYKVEPVDNEDKQAPQYQPDWNNLKTFDFEFRSTQSELLKLITRRQGGRIDCATGYGKSFILCALCALYPKASFDIVCKSVAVVRERLHPTLVQMFGDVGLVGGGSRKVARRINCYTADSMQRSPATSDFLIGDEIHLLATDRLVEQLTRWQKSRNFGLTASMDVRFDNNDFLLTGVFGPLIYKFGYQDSVNTGAVVPIKVLWRKVVSSTNPVRNVTDSTQRLRYGIWRNSTRNQLIVADARSYTEDTQVLITCATTEHALILKKLLPEFTVVFRELTDQTRIRSLVQQGLLNPNHPRMTSEYRSQLAKQFERGDLKKVICTTVWNIGVSFDSLSVLIRADGTASTINDIQIPGRTSRISEGKEVAIVHDYEDAFDDGFRKRSGSRRNNYARQGWEQAYVAEIDDVNSFLKTT